MIDPDKAASDSARPPPREANDTDTSSLSAEQSIFPPIPGQRWRDYRIDEAPLSSASTEIKAVALSLMLDVLIRVGPVGPHTSLRRRAWTQIAELQFEPTSIVPLVEAHEEHGRRYEIVQAPPALTLRAWLVTHPADLGTIERMMRQVAPVLETLHAAGLAHLSLTPDSLFVDPSEQGLNVMVGGLENTFVLSSPAIPLPSADPLYAPPEASQTLLQPSAPALCAWDWWSLGRIVQEWVLGRHVLSLVLQRDIAPVTPEIVLRAAGLLAEKELGVRPGAVELMPDLEPALARLLRGLLTASPQGRWQGSQVRQWLEGDAVSDRYALCSEERLFEWKGRSLSSKEAAEFFALEENWDDGEWNLFADPSETKALINFLKEVPAHRAEAERLGGVLALVDRPAWQGVPLPARRTALASAAWVTLAGPESTTSLRIRGRGADWLGLQALFKANPTAQAAPLFHAIVAKPFVQLVETLDASTARSLKLLASGVTEAFLQGERLGLIVPDAMSEHAQVFALGLESSKELEGHLKRLRSAYASHRNPEIAGFFNHPKPERWMLVLLAYAGERATETGFVTHAERNLDFYRDLRERAETLTTVVFWERLRQALVTGPLLLAPWWLFLTLWAGLVAAAGIFAHAWIPAVVAALAIVALRFLCMVHIGKRVRAHGHTPVAWTWRDHVGRCARELARIRTSDIPSGRGEAARRLAALTAQIAAIALQPRPSPPPALPAFSLVRAGSIASALAALALLALLAPVAVSALKPKSLPPAHVPPGETAVAAEANDRPHFLPPPPGSPAGLYERFDDGFGRQPRGPLVSWDVPPEAVGPALSVLSRQPASAEQSAYALISGQTLLKPYPSKGVSAVLAVRVPAGDAIGLMLFDGTARKLAGKEVFIVQTPPQPQAWHRLGGYNVVYLGVPENLARELEPKRR